MRDDGQILMLRGMYAMIDIGTWGLSYYLLSRFWVKVRWNISYFLIVMCLGWMFNENDYFCVCMLSLWLIPILNKDFDKHEICGRTKIIKKKKNHKIVIGDFEIFGLNLFERILTCGNNRYLLLLYLFLNLHMFIRFSIKVKLLKILSYEVGKVFAKNRSKNKIPIMWWMLG